MDSRTRAALDKCTQVNTISAELKSHKPDLQKIDNVFNPPLSAEELQDIFTRNLGAIWIKTADGIVLPAILDMYEDKLVAVWCAGDPSTTLCIDTYGEGWVAFIKKPPCDDQ